MRFRLKGMQEQGRRADTSCGERAAACPEGNKAMTINKRRYKKGPAQRARLLVKRKRREELRKMRAELRKGGVGGGTR
jgi:hypothetical protein